VTSVARVLAAFALTLALGGPARAGPLTVFAAASLKGSLDEAVHTFEAATGNTVRVAYGASSTLARQIDAGAPAQVFISADKDWMDYVESRGLLAHHPVVLLTNSLVLVAPAGSVPKLPIGPGFAIAAALHGGRLAVADPRAVPAGKYARAALESLGVWHEVEGRLASAENVRAALALVARGEAPLGIVYRTDAMAEAGVAVVDTFPASSHPSIVYPMGVLRGAPKAAGDLAAFLASPAARSIWMRYGFGSPP
jgi:molybdate transport system substrate-binding protein